MHPYPHRYSVHAGGGTEGPVRLGSAGLPALESTPPPQFDGPPGYWSPETLLLAAAADCYLLSFRAVARASKLAWDDLQLDVEGVLDRVDGVTRFTELRFEPVLRIPGPEQEHLAQTVLEKAKKVCLITNSLNATSELKATVVVGR
ncbi:OsmC family protein [Ramlibacter tataouinensis]|uniref:OsmC family protein n=1 Tax=Ramlibacter tataouinensis TaxID=94132 RepID=UPI0022F392A6|nr:OsmC family protein [Ramlibacter tataouinensis]WBY02534.1 OsmC family protein [Ramlibacter tataouinensis]